MAAAHPAPMQITTRTASAVLVALALLGAFVAYRALRAGPSDEERIREIFEKAARAVEARRPGDVTAAVSEDFEGQGMRRRELQQLVTYEVLRGSWNVVIPVAAQVRVDGDRAEATVDVALVRGGSGAGMAGKLPEAGDTWRVEAGLAREKGDWRVVTARWRRVGMAEGLTGNPR